MEQVFLRLHVRLINVLTKITNQHVRKACVVGLLFQSLVLLSILTALHLRYIGHYYHPDCLESHLPKAPDPFPTFVRVEVVQPKSVHINLQDFLTSTVHHWKQWFDELLPPNVGYCKLEKDPVWKFWMDETCSLDSPSKVSAWRISTRPNLLFEFSSHKGYIMVQDRRSNNSFHEFLFPVLNVSIPSSHRCLQFRTWEGEMPILDVLSDAVLSVVGYDTIIINTFIRRYQGQGFLYNVQSRELHNLNYAADLQATSENFSYFLLYKLGILCTTLFLFFTTTTLVSFTLRETQQRMLKFTFLLQYYIRNRIPFTKLIITHVVESLVFVPIMVGMLFFLFEFFKDQLLAFLVLSVVWLSELYSVVSIRTKFSIHFFPTIFFCYFALFHIYFFSFPFGFSYLALLTSLCFIMHAMFYFWNKFEVPALETNEISANCPRQMEFTSPYIGDAGSVRYR